MSNDLAAAANAVLDSARAESLRIATAESCTGGLIAACVTELSGSSHIFERGFVTYANEAKNESLGVPEAFLKEHGAVKDRFGRRSKIVVHPKNQITA